MGGCCCCSSRGAEINSTPAYYYVSVNYPRASEERVPLSAHHGSGSAFSTGLLVDTNLETSIPDAYRPPPAPIPFDAQLGHPQTAPVAQEICSNKGDTTVQTDSNSIQESNTQESSAKCEGLKESDGKTGTNFELEPVKDPGVERSKSVELVNSATEEEEDGCPICLEEYDTENPKITTKCGHHFHLACIFEWMERSDTCAVCDQEMIFSPPID